MNPIWDFFLFSGALYYLSFSFFHCILYLDNGQQKVTILFCISTRMFSAERFFSSLLFDLCRI